MFAAIFSHLYWKREPAAGNVIRTRKSLYFVVFLFFQEAIDQGADFIECDVIVSKDLEYLCLHDNWISDVTNVKEVFPDCEETLYVPDFSSNITDCFAHRFTLAQLKTLKVKQSKSTRDPQYDLQFEIPTLQKYLDTAKNADRVVGIYPELKNPNFVRGLSIWDEISSTR